MDKQSEDRLQSETIISASSSAHNLTFRSFLLLLFFFNMQSCSLTTETLRSVLIAAPIHSQDRWDGV